MVIKQIVRMSSKIYKRYKLMGDKMGNKRKIKRIREKGSKVCVYYNGAKKKIMGIIKGVN